MELEAARALFEVDQVRAIREARKRDGTADWRAAAWLLKHSSPEGYGPPSRLRKAKRAEETELAAEGQEKATPQRAQEQQQWPGTQSEKCANLPETPRAGRGVGAAPDENCAILPETPDAVDQGPRLSRRERRAAERQQVKAMRAAGQEAV